MPKNFGPKCRTVVYCDLDTKRILGFGPEDMAPTFPPGTRYETKIPFDALELDKWVDKYAEEMKRDVQEKNYRQYLREKPIRDAIYAKLRERNKTLDPINRDLNNAFMLLQDKHYQEMLTAKDKVEHFLVAQGYDESFSGEDLAMENKRVQLT